eukprot:scaffold162596_cov24-Tisochrysis_lutea.AAC.3
MSVSVRRSLSHSHASTSAREAVSGSALEAGGSSRERGTRVWAVTQERSPAVATRGPSCVGGGSSGSTFQETGSARDHMLKKAAHRGRSTGSPPECRAGAEVGTDRQSGGMRGSEGARRMWRVSGGSRRTRLALVSPPRDEKHGGGGAAAEEAVH